MYEASASTPAQLDSHYRSELPQLQWQILTEPMKKGRRAGGLMAMRQGVTVTLSHVAMKDGRSITSILPMDTAGETLVKTR